MGNLPRLMKGSKFEPILAVEVKCLADSTCPRLGNQVSSIAEKNYILTQFFIFFNESEDLLKKGFAHPC